MFCIYISIYIEIISITLNAGGNVLKVRSLGCVDFSLMIPSDNTSNKRFSAATGASQLSDYIWIAQFPMLEGSQPLSAFCLLRVKVKDTMFPYMFPFHPVIPQFLNESTPTRSELFVAEHHLFSCHYMSSLFHPTMGGLLIFLRLPHPLHACPFVCFASPVLPVQSPPWQDRYPSSVDKTG